MSDYHQYVTTLALQKLAAWAFAVGEGPRRSAQYTGRRPHRGQLPDVDFDRAVPVPRGPSLFMRLFRLFRAQPSGSGAAAPEVADSATSDGALGEADRKAYVRILDGESGAARSDASALDKNRSRAA